MSNRVFQMSGATSVIRHSIFFKDLARVIPQPRRILSFGCSTGEELLSLKNCFPSSEVCGAEIDPSRMEEARQKTLCRVDTLENLPGDFDLIFAMSVFCRWPPSNGFLEKRWVMDGILSLSRRIAENGTLVIYNACYDVRDLLCGAGFTFVDHPAFRPAPFVTVLDGGLGSGVFRRAQPQTNSVSLPISAETLSPLSSVKPKFRFGPGPYFTQTGPNQWRYDDGEEKQKLWLAVFNQPVSAGQQRLGGLCIQADRAMTVDVSLGRHGSTDYEGAVQRIKLAPGVAQSVKLIKLFAKPHIELKLQVAVLYLEDGNSANLTIVDMFII
jgi:hypothetical protein